jgi:hypothetical protein
MTNGKKAAIIANRNRSNRCCVSKLDPKLKSSVGRTVKTNHAKKEPKKSNEKIILIFWLRTTLKVLVMVLGPFGF